MMDASEKGGEMEGAGVSVYEGMGVMVGGGVEVGVFVTMEVSVWATAVWMMVSSLDASGRDSPSCGKINPPWTVAQAERSRIRRPVQRVRKWVRQEAVTKAIIVGFQSSEGS
jgi:hypothetical protein